MIMDAQRQFISYHIQSDKHTVCMYAIMYRLIDQPQ